MLLDIKRYFLNVFPSDGRTQIKKNICILLYLSIIFLFFLVKTGTLLPKVRTRLNYFISIYLI